MSLVRVTRINNKGVERALESLNTTLKDIAISLRLIQEQVTGFKRDDETTVRGDNEAPEAGSYGTDEEAIIAAEIKANPLSQQIINEMIKMKNSAA